MSNRTPARALVAVVAVVAAAVTVAACTSSKSGGTGPSGSSAPPTLVPSSGASQGQVHLKKVLVKKVPGTFKQKPDAAVNQNTGFKQAIRDDGRKMKRALRTLQRDRFQGTYQRVWTGFGGSTLRVILQQFKVAGGPLAYQSVTGPALMKQLGDTTPVTVPNIPTATGFTRKTNKQQTTIILIPVGVVLMQVRLSGKVALGQVGIAVKVARKQFKRL